MKHTKIAAMMAGAAAGAALTALAIALIFVMGTGIGGAAIFITILAVSGGTGFLMGRLHRGRELDRRAYQRGFQAGLTRKTLVIRQPGCTFSIRVPDGVEMGDYRMPDILH